jgi:aspartokinase/homoserine dehydrogenase 1
VLSAPAKVTNLLVALVAQTSKGEDASTTLADIEGIFTRLITGLKTRYANFADEVLMQRLQKTYQELSNVSAGQSPIRIKA